MHPWVEKQVELSQNFRLEATARKFMASYKVGSMALDKSEDMESALDPARLATPLAPTTHVVIDTLGIVYGVLRL